MACCVGSSVGGGLLALDVDRGYGLGFVVVGCTYLWQSFLKADIIMRV